MLGIDTNILVHALIVQDSKKHKRAQEFLVEVVRSSNYVISTQVVAELYATLLRVAPELTKEARELVEILSGPGAGSGTVYWRKPTSERESKQLQRKMNATSRALLER